MLAALCAAATAKRWTDPASVQEEAPSLEGGLAGDPFKPLLEGGEQMIVGTPRLTTHDAGQETRAVDGDGLDHTRAPRFRTELVVGAQNDTRPTPHLDLDGLTVVHESSQSRASRERESILKHIP